MDIEEIFTLISI